MIRFRWFGAVIALVLAVDLVAVVVHEDPRRDDLVSDDGSRAEIEENELLDHATVDEREGQSTSAVSTTSTTASGSSTSTSTTVASTTVASTTSGSNSSTTSTTRATATTTIAPPAPERCPDITPRPMGRPTAPGLYVADDEDGNDLRLIVPRGRGSVSPDGRTVVFVIERFAGICVGPVGGGPSRRVAVSGPLTSANRGDLASWSPDSSRFALLISRGGPDVRPTDVAVVNASSGTANLVSPGGAKNFFSVHWSPDGRSLGLAEDERLLIMDAEGSKVTVVHDAGERLLDVQWKPDGTSLLARGLSGDLRVVPRAGGSAHVVHEHGLSCDWDDGGRIAVETPGDQSGEGELTVIDGDGAVRPLGASGHQPRWTRSGRVVAFVGDIDDNSTRLVSVAGEGGDVRVLVSLSPATDGSLVLRPPVVVRSAGLLVFEVQKLQSITGTG